MAAESLSYLAKHCVDGRYVRTAVEGCAGKDRQELSIARGNGRIMVLYFGAPHL